MWRSAECPVSRPIRGGGEDDGRAQLLRALGALFGLALLLGSFSYVGGGAPLPERIQERAAGFGVALMVVGAIPISGSLLMRRSTGCGTASRGAGGCSTGSDRLAQMVAAVGTGKAHIDVATGSMAYQPGDLGVASIRGAESAGYQTNDRETPGHSAHSPPRVR